MNSVVLAVKSDGRRTRRPTGVIIYAWIVATLLAAVVACADPPQGKIVAWGHNDYGQTNPPPGGPNSGFIAVAGGGRHSLGLKTNGSILTWGSSEPRLGDLPSPNINFIAVAAGAYHSLGVTAGRSIRAWGCGSGSPYVPFDVLNFGQCYIFSSGIVTVVAGDYHSLGLKADGSIVTSDCSYRFSYNYGQCDVPVPNADFIGIAAGGAHSLGLKTDGSIVAWGYNGFGQNNVPTPNAEFIAVAAGLDHSLGLKADGSIVAWGYNEFGQTEVPEPNIDFIAMGAGYGHSLGLKADGSIVAWGDNRFGQTSVPAPNSDFVAISAGGFHNLAVQRIGACCELLSGSCTDEILPSDCSGTQQVWTEGAACVDVECEAVTGACCDHDPFGACRDDVTQAACDCPTCEWEKLASCDELDCPPTPIPTVGEWGLVVLTLLLLTGGKLAFRRANATDPRGS